VRRVVVVGYVGGSDLETGNRPEIIECGVTRYVVILRMHAVLLGFMT
jgi:hypothetical protein